VCDNCANNTFKLVYSYALEFHPVNFSEDLIYDRIKEETYQCTKCEKAFTKEQIETGLAEIKKKHKPTSIT
jgi:hypothetical protein